MCTALNNAYYFRELKALALMMQTNFLAKFNLPEKFCIVSFFSQNSSYYIIRVKRQMMRLLSLLTTVSGVFFAGAYILFRLNMAQKKKNW